MSSKFPASDFELPEFTPFDMEFWFKSVELIMSTGEYCDYHKYHCVKNHLLNTGHGWFVKGLPVYPVDGHQYLALRTHVLDFSDRFDEVIECLALFSCRDLKPSAFLYVINKIVGEFISKSMKRTFWLARLPRKLQKVMFASILMHPQPLEDRSLRDLLEIADGIAAYEKYHSIPSVKKLTISLPEYFQHDPELWFYSLDEVFYLNGIVDEQLKFEHTMNALHSEDILTAALFLTDLPNKPINNMYTNLRERIIKTFAAIKNYPLHSFVFRNTKGLSPRPLLQFLNDLAAKSGKTVSQLLIRTFWIMQLPIQTQAILFKQWTASRKPLQELDIDAMVMVAESKAGLNETMLTLRGTFSAPELDSEKVDETVFWSKMQICKTFQAKIALGRLHCDFMYRTYYKNNPSESVEKCTVFHREQDITVLLDTDAKRNFFEGCTCWYHNQYGEFAVNCTKLL